MKVKFLFVLSFLALSGLAVAVPLPSDVLITGLVSNKEFKKLLKDNSANEPFRSNFDSLDVRRADITPSLQQQCNNHSRSGSILQVTLTGLDRESDEVTQKVFYFTTDESVETLRLCPSAENNR